MLLAKMTIILSHCVWNALLLLPDPDPSVILGCTETYIIIFVADQKQPFNVG